MTTFLSQKYSARTIQEGTNITINLMNISQVMDHSIDLGNTSSGRSIYKGEYTCGNKYKAQIQIDRVQHYLGIFDSEIEAAKAYDNHAMILLGQRARTNFVYNTFNGALEVDSTIFKKLVDTQNFSLSQMEKKKETKTISPTGNRKRAYANIQDLPPSLSCLQSGDIVAMSFHPLRERNVVLRRRHNDISPLTTLIQSNTSKYPECKQSPSSNHSTHTSTTTSSIGCFSPCKSPISICSLVDHMTTITSKECSSLLPVSDRMKVQPHMHDTEEGDTIDNLSDPVRCLLQLRNLTTNPTSTAPTTYEPYIKANKYEGDPNTTTTLCMTAARASLAAATGADPACLSIALPHTSPYIPTTIIPYTTSNPNPMAILKPSRNCTYWAGVLYIDPVSELQVWKGTYVECSDTTTRPTAMDLITSTNTFEYNTMPNPNAVGIMKIKNEEFYPQSGILLGNYHFNGRIQTDSHLLLHFELLKDSNISYQRYKCNGSGVNLYGTFKMYGVYSAKSGVLELKRQYNNT